MALSALAQIVEDLNLCRALNSFHKKVYPENIFIFNDNTGKTHYKLLGGSFMEYEMGEIGTSDVKLDEKCTSYTGRYCAPEIFKPANYKTEYSLDILEFNYNASDVFSLAVCILLIVTEENKDKWNNLGCRKTLLNVINKLTNPDLKRLILRMTDFDFKNRIRLEELAIDQALINQL